MNQDRRGGSTQGNPTAVQALQSQHFVSGARTFCNGIHVGPGPTSSQDDLDYLAAGLSLLLERPRDVSPYHPKLLQDSGLRAERCWRSIIQVGGLIARDAPEKCQRETRR